LAEFRGGEKNEGGVAGGEFRKKREDRSFLLSYTVGGRKSVEKFPYLNLLERKRGGDLQMAWPSLGEEEAWVGCPVAFHMGGWNKKKKIKKQQRRSINIYEACPIRKRRCDISSRPSVAKKKKRQAQNYHTFMPICQ